MKKILLVIVIILTSKDLKSESCVDNQSKHKSQWINCWGQAGKTIKCPISCEPHSENANEICYYYARKKFYLSPDMVKNSLKRYCNIRIIDNNCNVCNKK